MRCSRVRLLIDDHVDGLLPAADAEAVRDHLDACVECRETAMAAKAASTSLAVWGDMEPPPCCFDGILAKIEALPPDAVVRPARPSRFALVRSTVRRWSVPSMAAAAAVVAGFTFADSGRPASARRIPTTVAATAIASPAVSPVRAPARDLRPGEEYVHLAGDRTHDGVRRVRPSTLPGGAFPVEASLFRTPR